MSVPPRRLALATAGLDLAIPDEAPAAPSLAARVRAKDSAAFRDLFDAHGRAVWRFLRDLLGDVHLADEGLQETFVRAFARIDQLRDDDRLRSWLLGIARNVAMEMARARRRDRPSGAYDAASDDAFGVCDDDAAQGPELLLLGREAQELVSRALGELGEERRAALLLRVDHGLAYEEIAQLMGWSIPKVKNEIHRGRTRLRALLESFHAGGAR